MNRAETCKFCNNVIEDGTSIFIQSTDCFHTVHKTCFIERAKVSLKENSAMFCPECAKEVSNAEIKNYLSSEEVKEIEQSMLD